MLFSLIVCGDGGKNFNDSLDHKYVFSFAPLIHCDDLLHVRLAHEFVFKLFVGFLIKFVFKAR